LNFACRGRGGRAEVTGEDFRGGHIEHAAEHVVRFVEARPFLDGFSAYVEECVELFGLGVQRAAVWVGVAGGVEVFAELFGQGFEVLERERHGPVRGVVGKGGQTFSKSVEQGVGVAEFMDVGRIVHDHLEGAEKVGDILVRHGVRCRVKVADVTTT